MRLLILLPVTVTLLYKFNKKVGVSEWASEWVSDHTPPPPEEGGGGGGGGGGGERKKRCGNFRRHIVLGDWMSQLVDFFSN